MKKLLTPLFSFCVALAVNAQSVPATGSPVLRADNIDEVVSALTLEEKVHLVIGCGMSMGSDSKFPGTAGRTYDIPRLGIPSAYLADGPHRLAMASKREFDSHTYHATEFPSSTTVAATFETLRCEQSGNQPQQQRLTPDTTSLARALFEMFRDCCQGIAALEHHDCL